MQMRCPQEAEWLCTWRRTCGQETRVTCQRTPPRSRRPRCCSTSRDACVTHIHTQRVNALARLQADRTILCFWNVLFHFVSSVWFFPFHLEHSLSCNSGERASCLLGQLSSRGGSQVSPPPHGRALPATELSGPPGRQAAREPPRVDTEHWGQECSWAPTSADQSPCRA